MNYLSVCIFITLHEVHKNLYTCTVGFIFLSQASPVSPTENAKHNQNNQKNGGHRNN
jgi:hypothetical protein